MNTLISKIELSGDVLSIPYSYTKRIEQSAVSQLLNHHINQRRSRYPF